MKQIELYNMFGGYRIYINDYTKPIPCIDYIILFNFLKLGSVNYAIEIWLN